MKNNETTWYVSAAHNYVTHVRYTVVSHGMIKRIVFTYFDCNNKSINTFIVGGLF